MAGSNIPALQIMSIAKQDTYVQQDSSSMVCSGWPPGPVPCGVQGRGSDPRPRHPLWEWPSSFHQLLFTFEVQRR